MEKKNQVLLNRQDGESENMLHQLGDFVPEVMQQKQIPGAVIGLLHKSEINAAGFGVTNVDHPLEVSADTLCQVGSISKTYTATALMRLMEMGKMELDATIRTYVPEFKVADTTATEQATIRHLLTHTGGWEGDFFYDSGAGDDALPKYLQEMAQLQQLAALGTVWSYSNSSFYLAGHLIEKVTGKSLEAAMQELVFEPLGLTNSYFKASDVITHRFAVGHREEDGKAKIAQPWALPRAAYAPGGVVCTVHDLLCYAHFHLSKGATAEGVLKRETLEQMYEPQFTRWQDEHIGLSWFIDDTLGTRQIEHGGATVGQVASLTILPEHDMALAVLVNASQGGHLIQQVRKWVFKEYLGLDLPEAAPMEYSAAELEPYAGFYSRPFADLELCMLGGRLVGQYTYKAGFPDQDSPPPPQPMPVPLGLCEKDRLLVLDGPSKGSKLDVIRRADGSIGWLRMGLRIHARQE